MNNNNKKTSVLIFMDMPLFPYRIYAYNELAERGYDLTVVSVSKKEEKYTIPLLFQHHLLTPKKLGPFVKLKGFHLGDFDNADVIIIPSNLRMIDYYSFWRRKYWQKTIRWGHLTGRTNGNVFVEKFRYWFFKNFPALIFYEASTRSNFISHGFDPKRLFVANNTQYVEPSTVHPYEERRYFLYVGRIQDRKGLDLAVQAFAHVKREHDDPQLLFVVVGGGETEQLKRIAKEKRVEKSVLFVGPVHDQAKLGEWFSHAIAYVSPGHVGLGVLHSFACGVPVITCSGRLHSVEISNCSPDNSFVVPYNVDDIASAMEQLYSDKKLQNKLSNNAYDHYWTHCTIKIMVDGIDEAIKFIQNSNER